MRLTVPFEAARTRRFDAGNAGSRGREHVDAFRPREQRGRSSPGTRRDSSSSLVADVTDSSIRSITKGEKTVASSQVTDTNDNAPTFQSTAYSFDVPENVPRGSRVGQVIAQDADAEGPNSQLSYVLISDWANDVFSLNPSTGVFTLTASLDYEQVGIAENRPFSSSSSITRSLSRSFLPRLRASSRRVSETRPTTYARNAIKG